MTAQVLFSKNDPAALFDALKIDFLQKGTLAAIKIHFGEMGNNAYLKPAAIKPIIDKIKASGALAFLTDANTLYKGTRGDAVNHMQTAYKHRFTFENTGLPVIIADGLTGKESVTVPVNLKHFKEVRISSAAVHADSIVTLTHFKGHEVTGFGGAIKNIGMGFGSRAGKQTMHSDLKPNVTNEKCTACGNCIKWCPTSAIAWGPDGKAFIDHEKCIGCGECIASCKFNAIAISWASSPTDLQEKIAEYFYGVWKDKKDKMVFFNFLTDIAPGCDCFPASDPPVVPDIGFLASYDPVAIDQASIDLVNKAAGKDIFREVHHGIDWSVQLSYAESLRIGERSYKLIEL